MNKIKKTIAISVAASIMMQSTLSAGIMENALQNYTPATKIKVSDSSGNTIKSMFYSGGYYFRFNGTSSPQPLWNFSPPEIEAGCNGFNMKGMFMSLLGLDQFGAMLQNAGTSLAWGVAVGLIYSLPGVASVFKMINQWAKDIQKLLSMACSSGVAIGKAIGDKIGKGYDKGALEKTLTKNMDANAVAKFAQAGASGIIDALGLETIKFDWESGFKFAGGDNASNQQKKDALSAPIQNLFGDYSLGGAILNDFLLSPEGKDLYDGLVSMVSTETKPISAKSVVLTASATSGLKGQYDLNLNVDSMAAKFSSVEEKQDFGLKMFAYALFYNLAGDIGYSAENVDATIKSIGTKFACSSASENSVCPSGMTKTDADAMLFKFLENPPNNLATTGLVGNIGSGDIVQLESLIMDGKSATVPANSRKIKELIAPKFVLISTKEKDFAKNNFMITASSASKDNFFSEDYVGTRDLSKCSIYNALDGKVADKYIESLKFDNNGTDLNCSSKPNLFFGDIEVYADILSKSNDENIAIAINKLTDVSTYMLTNAVFENLTSMLSTSRTKTNKLVATATTNPSGKEISGSQPVADAESKTTMLALIKSFEKSIASAKIALAKKYPDASKGVQGLVEYFEKLEKQIQERTAKNLD